MDRLNVCYPDLEVVNSSSAKSTISRQYVDIHLRCITYPAPTTNGEMANAAGTDSPIGPNGSNS